jgi:hypothetical protein
MGKKPVDVMNPHCRIDADQNEAERERRQRNARGILRPDGLDSADEAERCDCASRVRQQQIGYWPVRQRPW